MSNFSDFSNYLVEFTKGFAELCSKPFHSKFCKAFWSEECSKAVALRRRAWRNYCKFPSRENKTFFNKMSAMCRRTIKLSKRKKWRDFCSSLSFSTSESMIWKLFKSLQGKSSSFGYPIVSDAGELLNEPEIAEKFAINYAHTFQTRGRILIDNFYRSAVQISCNLSDNSLINSLFDLSELQSAIESLNLSSSPGCDFIDNKFLFYLPVEVKMKLLNLINFSWSRGLFDSEFKKSILVPLPKSGKDHSKVDSYRPVALLSCVGKLIEKLVFNRLYWYLESKNLIPLEQSGFRQNHSCIDVLLYLEYYIQLALRSKQFLIIVFFDIEKAFDSANHIAILYKLSNMGIKGRMLKWLFDFFSGRQFCVRIGSSFSRFKDIFNGVPQGSILSPILWSCLLSDLPFMRDVHKLLFADDLSLFVVDKDPIAAVNKLQLALNEFSNWLRKWGLVVNPSKSKVMFFTRKKITRLPQIIMNGVSIPLVSSHKFLGLNLDAPLLLWKKHFEYLREISYNQLKIMRALAGTSWGCDRSSLLIFYNSYIKSRLTYGVEVFSSSSNTFLSSLEVIQNHALRIITGLNRSTPIVNLQVEAGVVPICYYVKLRLLIMLRKIQNHAFNHRSFQLFSDFGRSLENYL